MYYLVLFRTTKCYQVHVCIEEGEWLNAGGKITHFQGDNAIYGT